jgi:hypothetical protein
MTTNGELLFERGLTSIQNPAPTNWRLPDMLHRIGRNHTDLVQMRCSN